MLPNVLLAWRKARGLSQKQLANRLGVSPRTVIRWERGDTPTPDDLELQLKTAHGAVERHTERVTSRITPSSHPRLFTFRRPISRFMPNAWHPNSLARKGLLGWWGCTWINASWHRSRRAPPAILDTEEYDLAVADLHAGAKHPNVVALNHHFQSGTIPQGMELTRERLEPWPWLTITANIEPLGLHHTMGDKPHPLQPGTRHRVQKALPDGYYWDPSGIVMKEDTTE